jgi:hypothetical protein
MFTAPVADSTDLEMPVLRVAHERLPVLQGVLDRPGDIGFLLHLAELLEHPGVEGMQLRNCIFLSRGETLLGRAVADRLLDLVELPELIERLLRKCGGLRRIQLVELAPHVRLIEITG